MLSAILQVNLYLAEQIILSDLKKNVFLRSYVAETIACVLSFFPRDKDFAHSSNFLIVVFTLVEK